ncbi:EF-hand domain-containing protein [Lysobacter sp. A03]|uniref:EF-hand domain-containing protein n=1 Tax=Lysobacter sp. A03 TaxID=1199154 RepID=UPI001269A731|nr:EF-hand domain-containing protein [Lysobacter sp. A03]
MPGGLRAADSPADDHPRAPAVPRPRGNHGSGDALALRWTDATKASSNPTLTAEFKAVDTDGDGKLSKTELEGWTR